MKKVYGSQSGFMWGELVVTKYNSGCMRSILLSSHGVRDTFDPKHQERGAFNEDLYGQELRSQNTEFVREESITAPIMGFDDTVFTGRLDYRVLDASTGNQRIDELKSSESYSVLKDVIKDGKYKTENLAQLISYMICKRCENGRLIYTYYKKEKSTKVYKKTAERVFEVLIEVGGKILVDGADSGFTVQDQLQHRQTAAECINKQLVWSRPYNANSFDGPCKRCVFKSVCDRYDADGMTTEEFISSAKEVINNVSKE